MGSLTGRGGEGNEDLGKGAQGGRTVSLGVKSLPVE